ncbi:MAG: hypothetical protein AAFQ36_14030 [Pseudomonadota bacterium]
MTLDADARAVLERNDLGGYTIPTSGLYPYQWNWDSVFAAWGFSTFDIDRAWTEFETLFASQWENGMVPHIIFHKVDPSYFPGPDVWDTGQTPPTSGITQPPVAAIFARRIWEENKVESHARLAALFPKLKAWHRWWHDYRCTHGPAAITHPWESGRDNCPDWDSGMAGVDGSKAGDYQRRDIGHIDTSMRPLKEDYDRYIAMVAFGRDVGWDAAKIVSDGPFLMADPAITFILLRAHRDLAALGRALQQDVSDIESWAAELEKAVPQLWNPDLGCYDAKNLRTGEFANVLGSGTFLAALAGIQNDALDAQTERVWNAVTYGLPSADPEIPEFEPRRYWRGPTWPFLNALLAMGYEEMGRTDLAERLRHETAQLIRSGGFSEYFDPLDATPCGGQLFTWTAAIWLTWAGQGAQLQEEAI